MTIQWHGDENFNLKTKINQVQIGQKIKLGELEITSPGEYEVGGTQIEVIDGIIGVFAEGMSIGHMKKGRVLSDEDLEKLNGIDILLIGVGGGEFTENKTALEVINQIEPSLVIPMHNGNVGDFAKEEGINSEGQDELKISKAELPADARQVVVLNAHR
ncbi:hypothetical protein A2V71_03715 [Candidatus Berkelbacteria bacterium RBG_13_40_8]|uniref:Zn-dependent hydrolase n=1 Tax=Candidatus Berkelbacteria bacterium RBG_13_40_8 TaxID=1797467 RepID=A0A1F5DMV3_9BACT|nr:MAG: hypothetical protein A2V71_03715 [Candidatus Berkelbacteria bacterium RBG_13_40_8]